MQLKALDRQLPDCYRSELSKESRLSSFPPSASSSVPSSTRAPLAPTASPKRFLSRPIPFPARTADLSKPCRCPLCPRSFLHNGGLRVHIERSTWLLASLLLIILYKIYILELYLFYKLSPDHSANYEQITSILRARLHQETSSIIRKGRRIDLLQLARDSLPTISKICGASFQVNFLFALLKDLRKSTIHALDYSVDDRRLSTRWQLLTFIFQNLLFFFIAVEKPRSAATHTCTGILLKLTLNY